MSPLENVKRLYLDYLNAGLTKDVIARKLKAQFPGAKFTFKGATLYVAFGLNPEQKVLGMELNAAHRLQATEHNPKQANAIGVSDYGAHNAGFRLPKRSSIFTMSKMLWQSALMRW